MNKGNIYLTIIILVIASISVVLYIKYELPKRSNIEGAFANVSISAKYENRNIETVLVIQNGETHELEMRGGYEFLQLRKGIYKIYNKNQEENFYRNMVSYNISEDTRRIDFELNKPKEVEVKTKDDGSLINVEMSSENYQNVKLCLKHSLSYIFVNMESVMKIDLLDGYEGWDKCYSLEKSLNGVEEVNVSYRVFRMLEEDDFIEIAIIDTDYVDGKYENQFENKDLGGEDVIAKIK